MGAAQKGLSCEPFPRSSLGLVSWTFWEDLGLDDSNERSDCRGDCRSENDMRLILSCDGKFLALKSL